MKELIKLTLVLNIWYGILSIKEMRSIIHSVLPKTNKTLLVNLQ